VINLNGQQSALSNGGTGASLANYGTLQGAGTVAMPVDHRGRISVLDGSTIVFTGSFTGVLGSAIHTGGGLQFDGPTTFESFYDITGGGYSIFRAQLDVGTAGVAGRLTSLGRVGLYGGLYTADILGARAGFGYDQLAAIPNRAVACPA